MNYTASQWLFAHELAKYMNDLGKPTSVTTMGTGIGEVLFVGNSEGLSGNRYSIREKRVSAASVYGYERVLDEIKMAIDAGNSLDSLTLSGDASDSFESPTVYTLKRSGDVRVMYCNVFNNIYKPDKINFPNLSSGPIPLRHMMEKELFEAYFPDVLCLQEYQRWFREGWEGSPAMTSYLRELGYGEAEVKTPDGIVNATPVFYLTDKLELEECGFRLYSGDNDSGTKSITWARFTVKKSGKSFVAMSTHFMWNANWLTREQAIEQRKSNVREALEVIDSLGELPIIFGGDFNTNRASEEWQTVAKSGLMYAKDIAAVFNASCGWKSYATYDSDINVYIKIPMPKDGNGLDHVFVKGNIEVNTFMTVTDRFALYSTDHCPKFADITLF